MSQKSLNYEKNTNLYFVDSQCFAVAIPSHNREHSIKDNVLKYLKDNNIVNECIYVFVADSQYDKYVEALKDYEGLHIINSGMEGLRQNRDFMRNYFFDGHYVLYLDDDIKGLTTPDLQLFIIESIIKMKENNSLLLSINPTGNKFFCANKYLIGLYFCVGCCYIEKNTHHPILYLTNNLTTDEKEDYYRTYIISLYFSKTIRDDRYTIIHKYKSTSGGMNTQDRINNNLLSLQYIHNLDNSNLINIRKKKNNNELIFNNRNYKGTLDIEKTQEVAEGIYIDKCLYTHNIKEYMTIIYDNIDGRDDKDNKPIAILYKGVLKNKWKYGFLEFMGKIKNIYSTQRGSLSGQIIPELLNGSGRDLYKNNNLKYDKTGTMVLNSKFDVCNPIRSISMGYNLRGELTKPTLKYELQYPELDNLLSMMTLLYNRAINEGYIDDRDNKNITKYKNSAFSTITINSSVVCATHKDNHRQVGWACMAVFRTDPKYKGINIQFPEYETELILDDGDVLLFDSKNIIHSNSNSYDENNIELPKHTQIGRYSIIGFNKA